jgi:hypothetical protein
MHSSRISLEICSPTAHKILRASRDEICISHQEHLHGLITILALIAHKIFKPCFMPEMLMGFTSQNVIPDLK